jgi:hypothetical protein
VELPALLPIFKQFELITGPRAPLFDRRVLIAIKYGSARLFGAQRTCFFAEQLLAC